MLYDSHLLYHSSEKQFVKGPLPCYRNFIDNVAGIIYASKFYLK